MTTVDYELDKLPESLAAAEAEYSQLMERIREAQRFMELSARRGIFLEGVIKTLTNQQDPTEIASPTTATAQ